MPKNPKIGVAAVIKNAQGELLAIRRGHEPEQGRWALPGGHLEWGETLVEAVQREVHEEVGIDVYPERLLYVAEIRLPEAHFVVLDFAARIIGSDHVRSQSDALEAQWINLAYLDQIEWAQGMKSFFQDDTVRAYLCI
ncbi:NUDIX hydrolase [Sulfobacillus thermosulfidooxidans]|uniref:NUDIX hydrolase n=1 Tax=Sulfobacillus thermosulfidooxidans TaxID=28034 RepID=UPI0006B6412A|nr:NUDIX domain-containing protein [Sulfobacillus thermosulfidooxidans]